jgi:hypothetical protein
METANSTLHPLPRSISGSYSQILLSTSPEQEEEKMEDQSPWRLATSSRSPPAEMAVDQAVQGGFSNIQSSSRLTDLVMNTPSSSRVASGGLEKTSEMEVMNANQQATKPSSFKTTLPVRTSLLAQSYSSIAAPDSHSPLPEQVKLGPGSANATSPHPMSFEQRPEISRKSDKDSKPRKRKQSQQFTNWQCDLQSMKEQVMKENNNMSPQTPEKVVAKKVAEVIDLCSSDEESPGPLKKKQYLGEEEAIAQVEILGSAEELRGDTLLDRGPTLSSAKDVLALGEGAERQLSGRDEDMSLSTTPKAGQLPTRVDVLKAEESSKVYPTLLPSPVFRESKATYDTGRFQPPQALVSPSPEGFPDEQKSQIAEEQVSVLSDRISLARSTGSINDTINQWLESNEIPTSKHVPGTKYEIEETPSPDVGRALSRPLVPFQSSPLKQQESLTGQSTLQQLQVPVVTEPSRKLKAPNPAWKRELITSRNNPPQPAIKRSLRPKPRAKKPLVKARTSKDIDRRGAVARPMFEDSQPQVTKPQVTKPKVAESEITDHIDGKISGKWEKIVVKSAEAPEVNLPEEATFQGEVSHVH